MKSYQQFTSISYDENIAKEFQFKGTNEAQKRKIPNLGHVNFFVGANNSGKSRFLRALFNSSAFQYESNKIDLATVNKTVVDLKAYILKALPYGVLSIGDIDPQKLDRFTSISFMHGTDSLRPLRDYVRVLSEYKDLSRVVLNGIYSIDEFHLKYPVEDINKKAKSVLKQLNSFSNTLGSEKRTYIPILRGLRPINGSTDVYGTRTVSDYNLQINSSREIFTGLTFYEILKKHLLGKKEQRQLISEYQTFLSDHLFDGKTIDLVPMHDSDTVHIKIGESVDRPIHELGDGVQSLIILTFIPFISKDRQVFFMEEPDLYLHPGMQRKLVELFHRHEKFAIHQFFMSTHSNHMLEMSADYPSISVYLFKRNQLKEITSVSTASYGDRALLHEIGARSSSVFLTNATIWVEGITDRLFIREFLQKYFVEEKKPFSFREDTHYSLVELGGANLVHYDFTSVPESLSEKINVIKVCTNSFVLIDGDNSQKGTRAEDLIEQLGENVLILPLKEIENALPPEALTAAANVFLKRNGKPEISPISLSPKIYQKPQAKIGNYLNKVTNTQLFASKSGTLKTKTEFCKIATQWMQENPEGWILSPAAKNAIEKVWNFIAKSNNIQK